ncbi:MAG: T9SS type A sorting domain-containing protein [Bacteroidota bacterium]
MLKSYLTKRLFAYLVLLGVFSPLLAGGGGPDNYGYTWKDSGEPEVNFSWIDVPNRPGAVQITTLGDDNFSAPISLGFSFRYYWLNFTSIRIGSNAWLSFDPGVDNNAWCFQNMPSTQSPGTNNTLAPLLADMNFLSTYPSLPNPGECWYWTNNQDSFVVSYINLPFWKDDSSGAAPPDWLGENTFQVILAGQDSSITFQYLDMDTASFIDRSQCASEVVIGIENSQGQIGLEPLLETVPRDSFAIKFFYPAEDTFEVRDGAAAWSMNPGGKGRFYFINDTLDVTGAVTNSGNVTIDTTVVVEARFRNQSLGTLWLERDTLDSIALGGTPVLSFPGGPVLPNFGQFFMNIIVDQPGDLNPQNNRTETEIDVVSSTDSSIVLRYAYNGASNTSISWPSGNNGVGMYIDFPYYPYRITALEVYVVGPDTDTLTPLPSGFLVEVQADDNQGAPGTVLASQARSSFNARDEWNFIPLPTQPVIDSGGVFVSWIQGGLGIGLGTQGFGPRSRQTFEIFGGAWAPYRFAEREDFMIRVYIDRFWVGAEAPQSSGFSELVITPNPSAGTFSLQFRQQVAGPVEVQILDLHGKSHYAVELPPRAPGKRRRGFTLPKLASGIYLLRLQQNGQSVSRKLIIRP